MSISISARKSIDLKGQRVQGWTTLQNLGDKGQNFLKER